jgi:hypothetical protein
MPDGKQVHRLQRMVRKARIAGLNRTKQILAQVNLAALEQSQGVRPDRLDQSHLHIWVAFRVTVQKLGDDAFDVLRRGRHLQHPRIAAPEQLRALAQGSRIVQ